VLLVVLIFLMLSTTYSKLHRTAGHPAHRQTPMQAGASGRPKIIVAWPPTGATPSTAAAMDGRSVELLAAALSRAAGPAATQAATPVVIVSADATGGAPVGGQRARRRPPRRPATRLTFATQLPAATPQRADSGRCARWRATAAVADGAALLAASVARPQTWPSGSTAAAAAGLAVRRTVHPAPAYRLGMAASAPVQGPCPLLVVGNLVAGGAGKTPAVMAVIDHAAPARGWTPGVVSRGHGGQCSVRGARRHPPASRASRRGRRAAC
jgi:hypothetical protein